MASSSIASVLRHRLTRILRRRPSAAWSAVGWLLLGAALRLYRLGNKNVWWDEGYSVWMARMPLARMFDATAHDTHPPFYYALLHGWRLLAGDSEFALRLLSVCAGIVLLAVAYRLVRVIAGTPAAQAALALLAVTRLLIWYSQEIRQYTLAAALALASLALAHRLWQSRGRARAWVAYILVTAAGLLTLYLFAGVVLTENLAFLIALRRAERGRLALALRWGAAQVLVAASFVPWLLYYLPRQPHFFQPPLTVGIGEVAQLYLNSLLIGAPWDVQQYWPIMLPGLALLLGGLALVVRAPASAGPERVFGGWALAIGGLAPVGLVWLLNLPTSFRLTFVPAPRYFLTQLPWATALLGVALAALARRWPRVGWAAGGLALVTFAVFTSGYYNDRYLSDDYKSAAATLAALRQPEDVVLLHNDSAWPVVDYHLRASWIGQSNGQPIANDAQAASFLDPLWRAHSGLWLLLTPEALLNDPDHRLLQWLTAHALATREFHYDPYARLYFFARTPARAGSLEQLQPGLPPPSTALQLSPAPGLTLMGAGWALPEYRVGETLHLFLDWRNAHAPGVYNFALRLTTPLGVVADEIPAALTLEPASPGQLRQFVDFPIRAYVGPGAYDVSLVAGPAWTRLGSLTVVPAAPVSADRLPPAHPLTARFESGLELRGYTATRLGGQVSLRLDWTAAAPVDQRYKTFVHLFGPTPNPATGSLLWAQDDHEPVPVTTWRAGAVIADTFTLTLPADAPPGRYSAEVGWYDFFTGQRLFVLDDNGQAVDSRVALEITLK